MPDAVLRNNHSIGCVGEILYLGGKFRLLGLAKDLRSACGGEVITKRPHILLLT